VTLILKAGFKFWLVAAAAAMVACPRPMPPPGPPDTADAAGGQSGVEDASWADVVPRDAGNIDASACPLCKAACDALARVGCPEANQVDGGDDCYTVLEHAQSSRKFDLKPACVAAAKDAAGVRACKTVRCFKVDGG